MTTNGKRKKMKDSEEPEPSPVANGIHLTGMRRFVLRRLEDVSGKSGVGIVAEGCQFSSGWCSMTWISNYQKLDWAPSIAVIEGVHGHGGKTVVEFIDPKPEED